ncbi:MAG: outer membrane protein assembly factor BamA [Gammaproteobacteria bacterium]|nr:outer membrane protein assembly factor BamA [Gammaproteobacteria bacterium]MCH9744044.1 outer membrane protein assembly factor BamA [Gammaproteobacteria bacterium]
MRLLKLFTVALLLMMASVTAFAAGFRIKNIEIKGLQRISKGTVISSLPVHIGETYSDSKGADIIKTLYKTGWFKRVTLQREGDTLILNLSEQPTIALILFKGIKAIPIDKLKPVLKKMGISEGNVYDSSKLKQIIQGLQQEYNTLGYYAANIRLKVVKEPRNTVAIYVYGDEGAIAKVRHITIVGNSAFSRGKLLDQFQLTTPGLFTLISHHDRYSEQQLDTDLQNLRNFYLNHGYLQFRVVSKNVKISDDNKSVYITVTVSEGPIYSISGIGVKSVAGDADKVRQLIPFKKGQVFSRQRVLVVDSVIAHYYADRGFAFPNIQVVPKLNNANHTVFLQFLINDGKRIYVRNINFIGNSQTEDMVFRTQMRQMEGALYNLKNIKESMRNLQNLPYITDVHMTPAPVPGQPNQVDLNYNLKEANAGRASVQGGYSDVDGFLYGASISEPNFMGTGKYVSIGFQNSAAQQNYSVQYTNPFVTTDGISRSTSIYYTRQTPGQVNLESYTTNDFGGTFSYAIPLTEFTSYSVGAGYDHIRIGNLGSPEVSPSVEGFVEKHGKAYNQFMINAGIGRMTLNRAIFPTSGSDISLSATYGVPALKSSLSFYKAIGSAFVYVPLGKGFILKPHVTVGFGNGLGNVSSLPFFNNFYSGGIENMPGFEANSLGPKFYPTQAEKNAGINGTNLGGNFESFAGVDFILPNFISDKIRISLVADAGNVWQTQHYSNNLIKYDSVDLKNVRATAGVMVSWWWPMGAPITFSIAKPIHSLPGDDSDIFGFSFGGALG